MRDDAAPSLVAATADVIGAHVNRNTSAVDLPEVDHPVQAPRRAVTARAEPPSQPPVRPGPTVPKRRSAAAEAITCLEDGQPFKSLERHQHAVHGLTPRADRARRGLPEDGPMVRASYATARADVVRAAALGQAKTPPPMKTRTRDSNMA
jgi:predicted transcriptional regulator